MTAPTEPLKVTLEEGLKLLAERRDGRRITYEVDTPDGEPCWVAWERYVTLGPADSWEGALAIALEQPVVARDEATEPKPIGWDDVTDEDFTAALLDCQEELKQARDEAAELRVEVERLRQDREPDHLYNQDNWEYTCPWAERGDILSDEIEDADGVVHYRTLYEGAYVFAANVPIEFDDDGCPVRFEIQWFDSQAAAEAALCALAASEGQP